MRLILQYPKHTADPVFSGRYRSRIHPRHCERMRNHEKSFPADRYYFPDSCPIHRELTQHDGVLAAQTDTYRL